jgi:hypothetical protein
VSPHRYDKTGAEQLPFPSVDISNFGICQPKKEPIYQDRRYRLSGAEMYICFNDGSMAYLRIPPTKENVLKVRLLVKNQK